ncbi:MAG: transposase [Planctomycetota bacterium]
MSKSNDVVKQIRRATRRKFSADEKIRIVLEGLRGEIAISELCRREGIAASVYSLLRSRQERPDTGHPAGRQHQ